MRILPPTTQPPEIPFTRNHDPKEAGWSGGFHEYRACLRWEFGFTCALCLIHEADLADNGVEGTGRTSVEHITPQRDDPDQANVYRNCLYACTLCNRARSTKPLLDRNGNRLLDPTCEAWSAHFEARDNKLIPKTGHGEHTRDAYDLNDPRKVWMRAERRERIERWCKLVSEGPAQAAALAALAGELAASDDDVNRARSAVLAVASAERNEDIRLARKWLARYQGTPADADLSCRCQISLTIPQQLAEQLLEV